MSSEGLMSSINSNTVGLAFFTALLTSDQQVFVRELSMVFLTSSNLDPLKLSGDVFARRGGKFKIYSQLSGSLINLGNYYVKNIQI